MNINHNIDKNSHYFILMHPLEKFGPITIKTSTSHEKWVECEVDETNYKVNDGYKIELKSLEKGYGSEIFYQEDFISFLEKKIKVVKKEYDDQIVVPDNWIEPLSGNIYLKHIDYTLTRKRKKR